MKKDFRYIEFIGTPKELDLLVIEKRMKGLMAKIKRVADLDDGRRHYRLKLAPCKRGPTLNQYPRTVQFPE